MATHLVELPDPDRENVFQRVRREIEELFHSLIEKVNERREVLLRQLNQWEEEFNRTRASCIQSLEEIKREQTAMEQFLATLKLNKARTSMEKGIADLSNEIIEKEQKLHYPQVQFVCDINDLNSKIFKFGSLSKETDNFLAWNYTQLSIPVKTDFGVEDDFGVEEEITDIIQSLVRDIPMDTLVKELIQNAEDAKATEIVFILDAQTYTGCRETLSLPGEVYPNWKHLHSFPSLSVYNNKGFTEEDLRGIHVLSVGRKTEDRKSIGKFGLGFNSVYQITDAPTFITTQNGQEGLTFCCFDPFIKYTGSNVEPKNSKKKRGKKISIESKSYARFSDQLFPFRFERFSNNQEFVHSLANMWNNSEFTMFRFPLDIASNSTNPEFTQLIPYKKVESRKHCSLNIISRMLIKQIRDNSEMLLFLENIKSLKVISISETGVAKLECSQNLEI